MDTSSSLAWGDVIVRSFQNAWVVIINFLPSLLGALLVLIIGLLIASLLRMIFEKIIRSLRLDSFLQKLHVGTFLERGGIKLDSGKFVGAIVYWFFVIVVVLAASDILGLWGLSSFLSQVLLFFPDIIIAVLIMVAALILANFLRSLVRASAMGAGLRAPGFLASLTWWSVVIFGSMAALLQLGVAQSLIQIIVTGIIAMLALAGGIAFGLGGKDFAAEMLARFRSSMERGDRKE